MGACRAAARLGTVIRRGGLKVSGDGHLTFDCKLAVHPLRLRHRSLGIAGPPMALVRLLAPELVGGPRPISDFRPSVLGRHKGDGHDARIKRLT